MAKYLNNEHLIRKQPQQQQMQQSSSKNLIHLIIRSQLITILVSITFIAILFINYQSSIFTEQFSSIQQQQRLNYSIIPIGKNCRIKILDHQYQSLHVQVFFLLLSISFPVGKFFFYKKKLSLFFKTILLCY